jgi:hypothetical protein
MEFELTTLVVIGTDCKGSCKSNFHTITATTHPCPKVHTLFCHDQHTFVYNKQSPIFRCIFQKMKAVKCPTDDLSVTNFAIVCDRDFDDKRVK